MSWATRHIAKLREGETVQFRPSGRSMRGRVEHRSLCTVEPITGSVEVGDVVLCKVNGNHYLHLVKATTTAKNKVLYQIGNNHGAINGWVGINCIYGKLISTE